MIIKNLFNNQAVLIVLFIFFIGNTFLSAVGDNQASTGNIDFNITGLTPIYPEKNTNLIFIEAENAVTTNFDKAPIINYGCSGNRTLQLSRSKAPFGDIPYFADYVFYVEEAGNFELWYGGTPPGPKDNLYPSYTSPFRCFVDDSVKSFSGYREAVTVVGNYTPLYYWNIIGEQKLSKGKHSIRFEVSEKRGIDGKYYFYLDCLFFIRKDGDKRNAAKPLPVVFPGNMSDRKSNVPFKSADDYLSLVRENPEDQGPLIDLSIVYSLAGDYLSAIKYLKQAYVIDSENTTVLLLLAKNNIWRNDINSGLDYYSEYFALAPSRPDAWLDAAKAAAWSGNFEDSIKLYRDALARFPENPGLTVNLSLAYTWAGMNWDAENTIKRIIASQAGKPDVLNIIAGSFIESGYPEKAIDIYKTSIASAPKFIDTYILLAGLYYGSNKKDEAAAIKDLIARRFTRNNELDQYVAHAFEKLGLTDEAIGQYAERVRKEPDNITVRDMLVTGYFWNKQTKEAVYQSLAFLASLLSKELSAREKLSSDTYELIDRLYTGKQYFSGLNEVLDKTGKAIGNQREKYTIVFDEFEKFDASRKKAIAAGQAFEAPNKNPADALKEETQKLDSLLSDWDAIYKQYNLIKESIDDSISKWNALQDTSSKEQAVFSKKTGEIKWTWDKAGSIAELTDVSANGFSAAEKALIRIYLSEKDLSGARKIIEKIGQKPGDTELAYLTFELLVREGKNSEALSYYVSSGGAISGFAPYVAAVVHALTMPLSTGGSVGENREELSARAAAALDAIGHIRSGAGILFKKASDALAKLEDSQRQSFVRSMFAYEEETIGIRDELGDFYLSNDTSKATGQYKKALAIDPWDTAILYKLGTVYSGNKKWPEALDCYKRIYRADPTYENAAGLYNEIAKEHADTVDVQSYYMADTGSVLWNVSGEYDTELNDVFGLTAKYESWNKRVFRWARYNPPVEESHYSYMVHTFSLGFPVSLPGGNIKLTPRAGVAVTLNDLLYDSENNFTTNTGLPNISPGDFLGFNNVYPIIGLGYGFDFSPAADVSGEAEFGLYPETYGFLKDDVYEVSGNCNWVTSLQGVDVPVLKNLSFRAFGEIHYLFDHNVPEGFNIIWTALAELVLTLYRHPESNSSVTVFANGTYQDSMIQQTDTEYDLIDYYSPQNTFVTGGGMSANVYVNTADNNVFGLALIAGLFYDTQYEIFPPPEGYRQRLKCQLDLNLEYTLGNSTFYLKTEYVMEPNLETGFLWDYWNIYVSLGYTAKLPNLLAQ